jgi:hypothetical protein
VFRPQDPQIVDEQSLEGGGATGIPGPGSPPGKVVAGVQGVGVFRPQDPQIVDEQSLEGGGATGISGPGSPPCEAAAGVQGVRVFRAELVVGGGVQVGEVVAGGADQAGRTEAGTSQEQDGVGAVNDGPQEVAGVLAQDGGVGVQRLDGAGVGFEVRPQLVQGVGGGMRDGGQPARVELVAGGTLDQRVHAHDATVGIVGDQVEPVQVA